MGESYPKQVHPDEHKQDESEEIEFAPIDLLPAEKRALDLGHSALLNS